MVANCSGSVFYQTDLNLLARIKFWRAAFATAHISTNIRGAFNKFPDFFCAGIYNCRKLEIFQYVVTYEMIDQFFLV